MLAATILEQFSARPQWRVAALFASAESFLERQREQLPLWFVVALGAGVAAWLALPGAAHRAGLLLAALGLALGGAALGQGSRTARALVAGTLALTAGLLLAWGRSEWVAAPRLERVAITAFEAEVESTQPLAARDSLRMVLAPDAAAGLPPRIRVNLDDDKLPEGLGAGSRIRLRARLTPPMNRPLPSTHDYARDAWFGGIGATGRALGEVEVLRPAAGGGLEALRDRLDRQIRSRLPESEGAIATALATGDQGALPEEDAEAMRRSGLTHLLSVSGLHIAAAVGAAMMLSLRVMALSERLALRVNLVLVAAAFGALAGIGYTVLTGMQVPTVRSCIAALLVLAGIALGREAISMRLIAAGALAVLLVRPEALYGASFQFSFAAVTSIVALYSTPWFKRHFERREDDWPMRLARGCGSLLLTGLAVELALLPFALFHFHKAGLYGVLANMVAIPLTTFVVMPLEAGALLLDAVGLGAPLWWAVGQSIGLLLWLAHAVAAAPGSVTLLPAMPGWAFAGMAGGFLWLCLWSGPERRWGLLPAALGALGAAMAPTPHLLVTGDGRHLAMIAADGTPFVLRERAGDFVRDMLGENAGFDGELPPFDAAPNAACSRDSCVATIVGEERSWGLLAIRSGQRLDWGELTAACGAADIVVADRRLPKGCRPRWLKLDSAMLRRTGGVALYLEDEPRVDSVADALAGHPWGPRGP